MKSFKSFTADDLAAAREREEKFPPPNNMTSDAIQKELAGKPDKNRKERLRREAKKRGII